MRLNSKNTNIQMKTDRNNVDMTTQRGMESVDHHETGTIPDLTQPEILIARPRSIHRTERNAMPNGPLNI